MCFRPLRRVAARPALSFARAFALGRVAMVCALSLACGSLAGGAASSAGELGKTTLAPNPASPAQANGAADGITVKRPATSTAPTISAGPSARPSSAPPTSGAVQPKRTIAAGGVYPAREPIVVTLQATRIVDGTAALPADAAKQVAVAIDPKRLLLIRLAGIPLRFADLPERMRASLEQSTYEQGVAAQLATLLRDVRRDHPGAMLGVVGLPVEGSGADAARLAVTYRDALSLVTVMAPNGGLIASGVDAAPLARTQYKSAFALAEGRPVMMKGGDGWQVAVGASTSASSAPPTGAPKAVTAAATTASSQGQSDQPPAAQTQAGMAGLTIPQVITDWGSSAPASDGNGDGVVDGYDLAIALMLNPDWSEPLVPPDGETPGATPPALQPGTGFAGPTPQPPAVGLPGTPGYAGVAIARWTDVPMQVASGIVNVGVAAFHRNGIDRVEFSANGGPWVAVSTPMLNPSTNVYEYYCTLNLGGVADGLLEVRAIAYPKLAGTPRLLGGPYRSAPNADPPRNGVHSFYVWANTNGTYTRTPIYVSSAGSDSTGDGTEGKPFLTLGQAAKTLTNQYGTFDGCEIRCLPGTYVYSLDWGPTAGQRPVADDRWPTITAAAGVDREEVILTAGRPNLRYSKIKDCTISGTDGGNFYAGFNNGNLIWFDNCSIQVPGGRHGGNTLQTVVSALGIATGTTWFDVVNGPTAYILVRSCNISKLAGDVVTMCQSVFGVVSDDGQSGPNDHPDVYQTYSPDLTMDNILVDGVQVTNSDAQGIFLQQILGMTNSAFVNVSIHHTGDVAVSTQIGVPLTHVLFLHGTHYQRWFLSPGAYPDCAFVGNAFQVLRVDGDTSGVAAAYWAHNHFVETTGYVVATFGSDISSGSWSGIVTNAAAGDFTPTPNSVLLGRVTGSPAPSDAANHPRPVPAAVGAYEKVP